MLRGKERQSEKELEKMARTLRDKEWELMQSREREQECEARVVNLARKLRDEADGQTGVRKDEHKEFESMVKRALDEQESEFCVRLKDAMAEKDRALVNTMRENDQIWESKMRESDRAWDVRIDKALRECHVAVERECEGRMQRLSAYSDGSDARVEVEQVLGRERETKKKISELLQESQMQYEGKIVELEVRLYMYIYIYIYVCVYVCMYMYVCIYINTCE
jgi:hypothetical protein